MTCTRSTTAVSSFAGNMKTFGDRALEYLMNVTSYWTSWWPSLSAAGTVPMLGADVDGPGVCPSVAWMFTVPMLCPGSTPTTLRLVRFVVGSLPSPYRTSFRYVTNASDTESLGSLPLSLCGSFLRTSSLFNRHSPVVLNPEIRLADCDSFRESSSVVNSSGNLSFEIVAELLPPPLFHAVKIWRHFDL